MAERMCPTCGDPFLATRGRRYCSESCWPSRRRRYAPDRGDEVIPATRDHDEVVELLWASARKGSVAAMTTLMREVRREGSATPPSIVDELARRSKEGQP